MIARGVDHGQRVEQGHIPPGRNVNVASGRSHGHARATGVADHHITRAAGIRGHHLGRAQIGAAHQAKIARLTCLRYTGRIETGADVARHRQATRRAQSQIDRRTTDEVGRIHRHVALRDHFGPGLHCGERCQCRLGGREFDHDVLQRHERIGVTADGGHQAIIHKISVVAFHTFNHHSASAHHLGVDRPLHGHILVRSGGAQ